MKLVRKDASFTGTRMPDRRDQCRDISLWQSFQMHERSSISQEIPIFGYFRVLKNTHKNPKFGKRRQVPTRKFPTKFPDWDLSHSSKFGIFVGIL